MNITEEQENRIVELINKGETNRRSIVLQVLDDSKQMQILMLYIELREADKVMEKLNITRKEYDETIEYLNEMARVVDSKMRSKIQKSL